MDDPIEFARPSDKKDRRRAQTWRGCKDDAQRPRRRDRVK
jgi:hypothetical protein